jgi:hypothetical protein
MAIPDRVLIDTQRARNGLRSAPRVQATHPGARSEGPEGWARNPSSEAFAAPTDSETDP